MAPVGAEDAGTLIGRARAGPAREADVAARACSRGDQHGGLLGGVVDDPEVDLSYPASSRERSIAAWIAFRNAARTPARSSSRIA